MTLVLINKTTGALTSNLSLAHYFPGAAADVFLYSSADLTHVVHQQSLPLPGTTVSVTMPASSITLLVVPPVLAKADFDGDTDVDSQDLAHFLACMTGPGIRPVSPGCATPIWTTTATWTNPTSASSNVAGPVRTSWPTRRAQTNACPSASPLKAPGAGLQSMHDPPRAR